MRKIVSVILSLLGCCGGIQAQSIHFSQFYNAPLLVSPANAGQMPNDDYRLGMNYRTQWVTVPVPYNTFSAFGDCKIGGNSNNTNHNNWLGLGLAVFSDKAGDGNLSLTDIQGDVAYHLHLSEHTMLSLGISGAYAQRSVNFSNLTFDAQWDGFTFNGNLPNGEKLGLIKTSYYTIGAGLNFAWMPSDNFYMNVGGSLANINKPVETFYGGNNTLDYRPVGYLNGTARLGPKFISETSVFFETQSGASEFLYGELCRFLLSDSHSTSVELILGGFARNADAIIGTAGLRVSRWQFMASYDYTMSLLGPYNQGYGALEFSLIYQAPYHPDQGITKAFGCPRFF